MPSERVTLDKGFLISLQRPQSDTQPRRRCVDLVITTDRDVVIHNIYIYAPGQPAPRFAQQPLSARNETLNLAQAATPSSIAAAAALHPLRFALLRTTLHAQTDTSSDPARVDCGSPLLHALSLANHRAKHEGSFMPHFIGSNNRMRP